MKDPQADVVAGKQLFVAEVRRVPHARARGTKGTTGPNLDEAFQQSLKEGFGETAVRGVVYKQILYPNRLRNSQGIKMPAKLVSGQDAHDVAAYVASVARQVRQGHRPARDRGQGRRRRHGRPRRTASLSIPADPTASSPSLTPRRPAPPAP